MAKKTTWIYVGLGLVILSILLFLPTKTKDKDFLEVRLYDANGNLIGSTETFATICQGTSCSASGVASMGFDMNVQNTGNVPLNFNIQSVTQSITGSEANTAFATRQVNNIAAGASTTFSSNAFVIPTSWVGQSITFTGTVGATVTTTGAVLPSKSGTPLTLVFNADPSGSFTVTSFSYRTGSGTAITTLPPSGNVKFRTTSTTYSSGAIGYNLGTCGASLKQYGFSGTSSFDCNTAGVITLGLNTKEGYVVCGRTGYGTASNPTRLYVDTGAAAPPFFDDADADRTQVSTSPTSINSALEVSC